MIKWQFLMLGALCGSSAMAQSPAVELEKMQGVWRGTIGDLPVHACFDWQDWRGQGELHGVYYYDRHLRPIRLEDNDGQLGERVRWEEPSGAGWQIQSMGPQKLEGRWASDASSMRIQLERINWEPSDEHSSSACGSAAFMAPRLGQGQISEEQADGEAEGYTVLRYNPPAHFQAQEGDYERIDILTFALILDQPGDSVINHKLAVDLEETGFAECFSMSLQSQGMDGDFNLYVRPELVSDKWLGLVENRSLYCGGAHPSHWGARRVFDRQSGEEVDPKSWLNERGLMRETYGSGEDAMVFASVGAELPPLLLANWPVDETASAEDGQEFANECRDMASRAFGWDIGLVRDGLVFIPSLPHVAMACAEDVRVPWNQLESFLSEEGLAVMADMQN